MKQNSIREIPKKNYFIFILMVVISLIISFYLLQWHQFYMDSNLSVPILKDYMKETLHYNELSVFLEENNTRMVYVGISDDESCRNFEKLFRSEIEKYHLQNRLIYLNMSTANSKERMKFQSDYLQDNTLFHYPSFIFFENQQVKDFFPLTQQNLKEGLSFLERYGVIND